MWGYGWCPTWEVGFEHASLWAKAVQHVTVVRQGRLRNFDRARRGGPARPRVPEGWHPSPTCNGTSTWAMKRWFAAALAWSARTELCEHVRAGLSPNPGDQRPPTWDASRVTDSAAAVIDDDRQLREALAPADHGLGQAGLEDDPARLQLRQPRRSRAATDAAEVRAHGVCGLHNTAVQGSAAVSAADMCLGGCTRASTA